MENLEKSEIIEDLDIKDLTLKQNVVTTDRLVGVDNNGKAFKTPVSQFIHNKTNPTYSFILPSTGYNHVDLTKLKFGKDSFENIIIRGSFNIIGSPYENGHIICKFPSSVYYPPIDTVVNFYLKGENIVVPAIISSSTGDIILTRTTNLMGKEFFANVMFPM